MATATVQRYATVNPYTGEVVREFESLDAGAVDRAVEAARELTVDRDGAIKLLHAARAADVER